METMAFPRVQPQGDWFYLCECDSYWDRERGRPRHRFLRCPDPRGKDGTPLASPSHRVDRVPSTFPVGRLALFHAAAQGLEVSRSIQEAPVLPTLPDAEGMREAVEVEGNRSMREQDATSEGPLPRPPPSLPYLCSFRGDMSSVAAHEESVIPAVDFRPPVETRGATDMCEELKLRGPKVSQDLSRSPGRMGRAET